MESEIERLRKKAENFPSASLYNRLAELARQMGDDAQAESACRRCIKEFPRSGQAYVILAEIHLARQQRADALTLLRQAVERDPRSYAAHRLLADLADSKAAAIQHLQQILAFKPNDEATVKRLNELGATPAPANVSTSVRSRGTVQATSQPGSGTHHPPAATGTVRPQRIDPDAPLPFPAPSPTAGAPAPTPPTPPPGVRSAIPGRMPSPPPVNPPSSGSSGRHPGSGSGFRRAALPARGAALDALCGEAGVRGALVVDAQGRVVLSKNLGAAQDELIAALSADILTCSSRAIAASGGGGSSPTWVFTGTKGQVLGFSRAQGVSVVVVADPGVRPAMLELRARQALIDLGAP